jgi:pyrimidine operon attenuation protein/uracil phosphoribosyltransferase
LDLKAPPNGGNFYKGELILDKEGLNKALKRISHEILEKNKDIENLALVGLQRGGVFILKEVLRNIVEISKKGVLSGFIDVSSYRDDITLRPLKEEFNTSLNFDVFDKTIVLLDDVLFTGRTVRAALNALVDFGRPKCVQLGVLINRGHRQLPIRPDYVGKNISTQISDEVSVTESGVYLIKT